MLSDLAERVGAEHFAIPLLVAIRPTHKAIDVAFGWRPVPYHLTFVFAPVVPTSLLALDSPSLIDRPATTLDDMTCIWLDP